MRTGSVVSVEVKPAYGEPRFRRLRVFEVAGGVAYAQEVTYGYTLRNSGNGWEA